LLAQRDERNILLIVVTGDKGLAGAFNTNILKAATRFLESKAGKNIEIEAIGRKGRDFLRRRFPAAEPRVQKQAETSQDGNPITIIGERIGVLNKIEYSLAEDIAQRVIQRYCECDIDSVYLLFNEFKSVIAQRLVVEQILPIEQIGESAVRQAEELSEEQRERAGEAAKSAGVGLRAADTTAMDEAAAKFGTAQVDYIYEQSPADLFKGTVAEVRRRADLPGSAGIGGSGARSSNDGNGSGHQQRQRHDRFPDVGHEPGAAGEDHQRDYRNCQRRSRVVNIRSHMPENIGHVIQIAGPAVDVQFAEATMPPIYEALRGHQRRFPGAFAGQRYSGSAATPGRGPRARDCHAGHRGHGAWHESH
jgi:ATP synthase F1 gamma subunit